MSLKSLLPTQHPLRFAATCAYVVLLVWGLLEFSGTDLAWQRMRQTSETSNAMIQHMADARHLARRNRSMLVAALQASPPSPLQVAEMEANIARISTLWSHAMPLVQDSREGSLSSDVASQRLQYLNDGLLPALELLRASDPPASLRPLATKALSLYEPFDTSLANLESYAHTRAERDYAAARKDFQTALLNFCLLTGLLLLLSSLLATLALRSLATAPAD